MMIIFKIRQNIPFDYFTNCCCNWIINQSGLQLPEFLSLRRNHNLWGFGYNGSIRFFKPTSISFDVFFCHSLRYIFFLGHNFLDPIWHFFFMINAFPNYLLYLSSKKVHKLHMCIMNNCLGQDSLKIHLYLSIGLQILHFIVTLFDNKKLLVFIITNFFKN